MRYEIVTSQPIVEIVDQGDRVLLYPEQRWSRLGRYHIIATCKQGAGVKIGQTVQYKPAGVNFGWMV